MKKMFTALIIALFVSAGVLAASSPSPSASRSATKANNYGITDNNSEYSYTEPITRNDFCILSANLLEQFIEAEIERNIFDDTDNESVLFLYSLGIIKGKSETMFCPNDIISREEAAVILNRMCNSLLIEPPKQLIETSEYNDSDNISGWAKTAVAETVSLGIMEDYPCKCYCFNPSASYSVEDSIVSLVKLYEYKVKPLSFADTLNSYMPNDKNYMFSPLSVKLALALAANGAKNETLYEITDVTQTGELYQFNSYAKDLINKYKDNNIITLDIANSVWLNSDNSSKTFHSLYLSQLSEYYGADTFTVKNMDAVSKINSWVKDKTKGKISEIIDNPDFEAALINAIYFKGKWKLPFDEKNTKKDIFHNYDGTETETDFMNQTANFQYYSDDTVEILKLPYEYRIPVTDERGQIKEYKSYDNLQTSMYILVSPEEEFYPVKTLEDIITGNMLKSERIKLSMPKFKIEFSIGLSEILQSMGIVSAFNPSRSDFTSMFTSGNSYISNVLHKTYIDVNEKETEAAAVTAVILKATSAKPQIPKEVKLEHPFTFIIRNDADGEILFMGRYNTAK